MNIHKNARLTPLRRGEMALSVIEGGVSKAQAARTFGVSAKIVTRWVERDRAEGGKGMADRSSRPNVMPNLTDQTVAERIVALLERFVRLLIHAVRGRSLTPRHSSSMTCLPRLLRTPGRTRSNRTPWP